MTAIHPFLCPLCRGSDQGWILATGQRGKLSGKCRQCWHEPIVQVASAFAMHGAQLEALTLYLTDVVEWYRVMLVNQWIATQSWSVSCAKQALYVMQGSSSLCPKLCTPQLSQVPQFTIERRSRGSHSKQDRQGAPAFSGDIACAMATLVTF